MRIMDHCDVFSCRLQSTQNKEHVMYELLGKQMISNFISNSMCAV